MVKQDIVPRLPFLVQFRRIDPPATIVGRPQESADPDGFAAAIDLSVGVIIKRQFAAKWNGEIDALAGDQFLEFIGRDRAFGAQRRRRGQEKKGSLDRPSRAACPATCNCGQLRAASEHSR